MGEVAPIHEEDDDQPVEGWGIDPFKILYVFRFKAVFRIREILRQIRIPDLESVHWITDPDPGSCSFLQWLSR